MANSLSPGSRVPVLHNKQGWGTGWSLAHANALPTPNAYSPNPGPEHPYLCATLPFLMSEMVRGSPRFLLAAGGREAMTDSDL